MTHTQLHIREYRGGTVTQVTDSSLLVDVWFNEDAIRRLEEDKIEKEDNLICVHWEQAVDKKELCSVLLTSQDQLDRHLALYLDTNSDKLFDFITIVFRELGTQLLYVTLRPIKFVFKHERRRSQQVNNKHVRLKTMIEQFINAALNEDVEVKMEYIKLPDCVCSGGNQKCSFMPKPKSTSSSIENTVSKHCPKETEGDVQERFNRIKAKLSKHKEIISDHFHRLDKQNKEICQKMSQIAAMLPISNKPLPVKNTALNICDGTGTEINSLKGNTTDISYTLKGSKAECKGDFQFQVVMDGVKCEDTEIHLIDNVDEKGKDKGEDEYQGEAHPSLDSQQRYKNSKHTVSSADVSFRKKAQFRVSSASRLKGKPPEKFESQIPVLEQTPEDDTIKDGVRSEAVTKSDNMSSFNKTITTTTRRQHSNPTRLVSTSVTPVDTYRSDTSIRGTPLPGLAQEVTVDHYPGTFSSFGDLNLRDKILRLDLTVVKEASEGKMDTAALETFSTIKDILGYTLGDPWDAVEEALAGYDETVPVSNTAMDTILCLDNSSFSKSERLKEIAHSFINGIEKVSKTTGLDENICLIGIGQYSRILHQLSNDYESLRNAVDSLSFGASTSCIQSLMLCLAGLSKGGVGNFDGNFQVLPRVIVVTDGISNQHSNVISKQMTDIFFTSLRQMGYYFVMETAPSPIIVVPLVGERMDILQATTDTCAGVIVEEITTLCSYQTVQRICAKIIKYLSDEGMSWTDRTEKALNVVEAVTVGLGPSEKKTVSEAITEYYLSTDNNLAAIDVCDNINVMGIGLVSVGTRVVPGPDLKTKGHDGDWKGTVVNHGHYLATVWVLWDHGPCRLCRYGSYNKYDVLIAEEQSREPNPHETISIGMQVERGPHWPHTRLEDDGVMGSYGTVVRKWKNRVCVMWKNQKGYVYKFGEDGLYHVLLRNPLDEEQLHPSTHDLFTAMESSCFEC